MPSFNPFTSVTGRNALTLFDIRLDNDFLVFRGNDHEASGQLLKGVVAICVPAPIKIEDIHLRLTGIQRLTWTDPRSTPSTGLSSSKVDRSNIILQHTWAPFWGTPGKSAVLEKGNYEFPFELLLPGDTSESVEGLHEASITYKLKATIARGKLAYDLHAYKHLRVVRTLESSALEFLHAMSVENIWPNKIEYSIVVPQKAIVFGSVIPLETRFTPLLKGLELGDISIRLLEIHDFISVPAAVSANMPAIGIREYKSERVVANWSLTVTNEEHWQDMIEDTGQEGWVLNTTLDLPHKLGPCIQDVNVHGIKVRHKLKMVVALKNPDGHVSELRATLPITLFISPNIPLDEHGNLTAPARQSTTTETTTIAPPGYGEHILDQLYDDMDVHNLQTPAPMSAVHSPLYGLSRSGSAENLSMAASLPVPPAALTSRLQDVSSREAASGRRNRNSAYMTTPPISGVSTPYTPFHLQSLSHSHSHGHSHSHNLALTQIHQAQQHGHHLLQNLQHQPSTSAEASGTTSESLTRHVSGESHHSENSDPEPEHIDFPDMSELCKVPSYGTAMKNTRVAPIAVGGSAMQLPDYRTAASASASRSSSPTNTSFLMSSLVSTSLAGSEPLFHIAENETTTPATSTSSSTTNVGGGNSIAGDAHTNPAPLLRPRHTSYHSDTNLLTLRRRHATSTSSVLSTHSRQNSQNGESDERSWLHLLQSRGRVATTST